jgi:uncharacterized protein
VVIFVDTSGLLALLDADEPRHRLSSVTWLQWIENGFPLWTTNYVILETSALTQNRLGMEAVRDLHQNLVPLLNITWIDSNLHASALTTFFAANRRQLSLVDCTSFTVMHSLSIEAAFAFDDHFVQQGFTLVPAQER